MWFPVKTCLIFIWKPNRNNSSHQFRCGKFICGTKRREINNPKKAVLKSHIHLNPHTFRHTCFQQPRTRRDTRRHEMMSSNRNYQSIKDHQPTGAAPNEDFDESLPQQPKPNCLDSCQISCLKCTDSCLPWYLWVLWSLVCFLRILYGYSSVFCTLDMLLCSWSRFVQHYMNTNALQQRAPIVKRSNIITGWNRCRLARGKKNHDLFGFSSVAIPPPDHHLFGGHVLLHF